jgi:hypothetical protein
VLDQDGNPVTSATINIENVCSGMAVDQNGQFNIVNYDGRIGDTFNYNISANNQFAFQGTASADGGDVEITVVLDMTGDEIIAKSVSAPKTHRVEFEVMHFDGTAITNSSVHMTCFGSNFVPTYTQKDGKVVAFLCEGVEYMVEYAQGVYDGYDIGGVPTFAGSSENITTNSNTNIFVINSHADVNTVSLYIG